MSFRKMSTARMDEEIAIIKCNPALDIVGISFKSGKVELFRFLNWKRIASLEPSRNLKLNSSEPEAKIIGFEWAPNGKYIAVIYNGTFIKDKQYFPHNIASMPEETHQNDPKDDLDDEVVGNALPKRPSSIAVFDISTHQQILFRNCPERMKNIVWTVNKKKETSEEETPDEERRPLPHDTIEIPYIDLFTSEKDFYSFLGYDYSKLVPEAKTTKFQTMFRKTERAVEMDLRKFEREIFFKNQSHNESFNVQISVTASGSVDFYAFGIYKILSLKLVDLLKECGLSHFKSKYVENDIEVEQFWNGSNIHEVFLMLRNKVTKKRLILSFPLSVLERRQQELYAFTSLLFQIDLRTEFLDRSLQKMSEIWQDLGSTINRMLSDYLPKNNTEMEDHVDMIYCTTKKIKLSASDFMEMLLSGHISPSMEKFLSDMSETDFKKLALNLEMYFVRLLKFNSEEMQSKIYQLLCFLNTLKAISLEKFRFVDLSLDPTEVNLFIRNTHAMLIKTTEMQKSICDSMKKLRSFIRWLSNCSVTYAKDTDAETRVELGLEDDEYFLLTSVLTNSDLHLVMEFLKDNSLTSGFRFPEVEFYLKTHTDPNIDRLMTKDNDEKDIAYRIFVAKRQEEGIFEETHESLENLTDVTPVNDEESSVKMDIAFGNETSSTVDKSSKESIKDQSEFASSKKTNSFAMKFEDFEDFEKDLYDETDDVDRVDERLYSGMGLYAHLVQLYDNFTELFVSQTCAKLSCLQTELFRSKIDQISVCEIPPNFGVDSDIQQLYDDSQCYQFLASICEENRQLFILQKDQESTEFNSFSMEFHYNNEEQRRIQLWIRDFKFFDNEVLTVVLSQYDKLFSEKFPQEDNEEYDEDVQKSQKTIVNQESGQFLLQIRFQSFIFAAQSGKDFFNTSNDSNSSQTVTLPKLDVCLDSKIYRKWLGDTEDQIIDESIELRELAKGTVNSVFASRTRNVVTIVANGSRKITFYDVVDSEDLEELSN